MEKNKVQYIEKKFKTSKFSKNFNISNFLKISKFS